MDDVRLDVGLYTHFVIDCSQVDFTGIEKLIFTVKNSTGLKDPPVIRREFTAGGLQDVYITPEESIQVKNNAFWDVDKVLTNGQQYKMTDNGRVVLRFGVGECID